MHTQAFNPVCAAFGLFGRVIAFFALICALAAPARAAHLNAADFDATFAPILDYADVSSAPAGAWVTLWGWNLGSGEVGSYVLIGDTRVTQIAHWSADRIDFQIPQQAVSGEDVL